MSGARVPPAEPTLVLRGAGGAPIPLDAVRALLAGRPDAAPDPSLPDVWWVCGDRDYLHAAIARRRAGREPYAARLALATDALTFRLDCVAFCLAAARQVAESLAARWPCRLEDGTGAETTLDDAFA